MNPLIYVAIILVAMMVFAPKPPQQKPASVEDVEFPLCEEGEEKTAVFGQAWTKSWMVFTVGNRRTRRVKIGGGKK